jgi:hypothetical protein
VNPVAGHEQDTGQPPSGERPLKNPARFPARAQVTIFNFINKPICGQEQHRRSRKNFRVRRRIDRDGAQIGAEGRV